MLQQLCIFSIVSIFKSCEKMYVTCIGHLITNEGLLTGFFQYTVSKYRDIAKTNNLPKH